MFPPVSKSTSLKPQFAFFVFSFLVLSIPALSQPTLTRIERETPSTGDFFQTNNLTELGGKLYVPYLSDILEFDENLVQRKVPVANSIGYLQSGTQMVVLGNRLLIDRYHFSNFYNEPALLDPATGIVEMIKDIHPSGYSFPTNLFSTGEKAYFQASDETGRSVWATDGTANGTIKLIPFGSNSFNIAYYPVGKLVFMYINNKEVWATDGTPEGTYKIAEGYDYMSNFKSASTNKYFYFILRNSISQEQIFRSDGTPENTKIVTESDYPYFYGQTHVFQINNKLMYCLYSGFGTNFFEFDEPSFSSRKSFSIDGSIRSLYSNGSIAYFQKGSGTTGTLGLWKTDGTSQGTLLVRSDARSEYATGPLNGFVNGKFVFSYFTASTGTEPWVTDGTTDGTKLLKDINPGAYSSIYFESPTYYNEKLNLLFFKASSPTSGFEFWLTDGTASGTKLFADIETRPLPLYVTQLLPTKSKLYVSKNWNGDRTQPQFFDIDLGGSVLHNTLGGNAVTYHNDGRAEVMEDAAYLSIYPLNSTDNKDERGLVRISNNQLQFLSPSSDYFFLYGLTEVNKNLFFTRYNPYQGYEPWVLQGDNENKMFQIKDIAPGENSSMPLNSNEPLEIVFLSGKYYFSANDNINGNELWVSDLSEGGTVIQIDLAPGSASSDPRNFFATNDRLFFTATVNNVDQVWVLDVISGDATKIADANGVKFFAVGDKVYFLKEYNSRNYTIWKTDGTTSGTQEILDLGYSYYSLPAIAFKNGLVFIDHNTNTGKYDFYRVDSDGVESKFKSDFQVLGLFSHEGYIYYTTGNGLLMTNCSDIDKFISTLSPTSAYSEKMYTKFGQDLFFRSSDYTNNITSLWKIDLFKQKVELTYNSNLLASGESIEFGTIKHTDESDTKRVTITNKGYVDWTFPTGFTLKVAGPAHGDFTIANPTFPQTLRPGESFSIDIKFAPSTGGAREAYIELLATDEFASPITVNLKGTGTDFPQNIFFLFDSDIPYNESPFELAAYATSQLPLIFTSSDNDVATFTSQGFVTKKFGAVTITASQPGNEYFLAAPQVQKTVNITIGKQSIALNGPTTYTFGDAPFQLTASTSSGNPVKAYTSSNSSILAIDGSTATIRSAGTATVTASVDGNQYFNAGEQAFEFTIEKAPQTIAFTALDPLAYGSSLTLTATGGPSGQPVTFSSSDPAIASISGSNVTLVKPGTVTITASQAGNSNYKAAEPVSRTLVITKAGQSITFEVPEAKTFGDGKFDLAGSASSGLPVAFSSSDNSIATVEGNTVTIHRAGTVSITAAQAGNTNYSPASNVVQALTINKAAQTISFEELPATATVGDQPIELFAEATSGLPVSFISSNPELAKVVGSTLEILDEGEVTVTASQAGNGNYEAAQDVSYNITIAPAVLSAIDDTKGSRLVYPNPATSYVELELPAGFGSGNFLLSKISGQVVKLGPLSGNPRKARINVEDIGPGVFILTISNERVQETYRLIKN